MSDILSVPLFIVHLLCFSIIATMGSYSGGKGVDLEKYPTAATLVSKCVEFFDEVQNL